MWLPPRFDHEAEIIRFSIFQVDLLFQLYSTAVHLMSAENPDLSFQDGDTSFGTRSLPGTLPSAGRYARRTASITSSSGFELVEEESISSESTPRPVFPSPESSEVCAFLNILLNKFDKVGFLNINYIASLKISVRHRHCPTHSPN